MALDCAKIGTRIKYFRTKKRLSQEKLAELSDLSSVFISYIERGERAPSLEAMINIANVLNVSADDLLSGNLLVSNSPHDSREFEILYDCTTEELSILLNCMAFLKEQLRALKHAK